jgi:hypothetical protein
MSARSGAEVVVEQETKYHIFLNWFTTTHLASCPSDHGHPVMNSNEMLIHGFDGIEKDLRILA